MAEKTYKVTLKGYKVESCEGEEHTHKLMSESQEVFWDNMSYEDLCKFEAHMMAAISGALAQLGMEELDKKKKGKK